MELLSLNLKKRRYKNLRRYLVDWDKTSRSKFQFNVKQFLRQYWSNDVVFEEFPIIGTRLTLDLYNANKKTAIEVQGRQHTSFVKFFHGHRMNFLHQLKRDQSKEKFCEINGIKLVTIFETDEIGASLFAEQGVTL